MQAEPAIEVPKKHFRVWPQSPVNATLKLRMTVLMLAIGILASLIVWAVATSWVRLQSSRAQARAGALESFGLTRHFQSTLLGLNGHLLNLAAQHDPNEWKIFESEWNALNDWIDQQQLSSSTERKLLDQINSV